MKKVTVWIGRNEILIPADLIPGSIADALYPRQIRNQAGVDSITDGSTSSTTFERLKEEKKQDRKLREKFPNLPEDYSFTRSEAQEYLAGLGLELDVRHLGGGLAKKESLSGIPSTEIIEKFRLDDKWSEKLRKPGSYKYLLPALVQRGKPGGEQHRWSPVKLGKILIDKKERNQTAVATVIFRHFTVWADEWERAYSPTE